jgi:ArsR family transcriptional regulator
MNTTKLDELVSIFKAFSDKNRLRIANILIKTGCELCVCEIADSLMESQYNVSRHLKELKNAGLVSERKDGRWVNYRITETDEPLRALLIKALNCIPGKLFEEDEKRLKVRLSMRKDGKCVVGLKDNIREKLLVKGMGKDVQKAK